MLKAHMLAGILALAAAFLATGDCAAADSAIDKGVAYLVSKQNADGSWSASGKTLADTTEAFKALSSLNLGVDARSRALAYAAVIEAKDSDKAARQLIILSGGTADTNALAKNLASLQNADGGWGLGQKKQSDVADTLLAVEALLSAKLNNASVFAKARNFLVDNQRPDGSWAFTDETSQSDVARAALGLLVLRAIELNGQESPGLTAAMGKAKARLAKELNNHSYGSILDTALAYISLLQVMPRGELQGTWEKIASCQSEDGSWGNDVYTTAVALSALAAVRLQDPDSPPDLYVLESGIAFTPDKVEAGTPVVITATLYNGGGSDAKNFTVEFFNRDPRVGGVKISEPQLIPLIPADGTLVVSTTIDTSNYLVPQLIAVYLDRGNKIYEDSEVNNVAYKELNVTAKPDLAVSVSDISFSTDSPVAFDRVKVSATVKNVGGPLTEGFVLRLMDGAEILDDINVYALGALESTTVTLNTEFSGGTHAITAFADPEDMLAAETNRSNNEATVNLAVSPAAASPPDLAICDIVTEPLVPVENQNVTLKVGVMNRGGTSIGETFSVGVKQGSTLSHTFEVPGLEAGQRVALSFQTQLPAGSLEIVAEADTSGAVTESDETNNRANVRLGVASATSVPLPDLTFSQLAVNPATLRDGDEYLVTFEVMNRGLLAASASRVEILDNGVLLGEAHVIPSLGSGKKAKFQMVGKAKPGIRMIAGIVDPADEIAESDEANNQAGRSITVKSAKGNPDLSFSSPAISFSNPTPTAFEKFSISAKISNTGSDLAPNTVVRFHDGGQTLASVCLGCLRKGETRTAMADVDLPAGSHDITVVADPDKQVTDELNRSNNQAEAQLLVYAPSSGAIDLAVAAIAATPHVPLAGEVVHLGVRVINRGGTDASVPFEVNVTDNGMQLAAFQIPALKAGADTVLGLDESFAEGLHALRATADVGNLILEDDKTNNIRTVALNLTSYPSSPDLCATGIAITQNPVSAGDPARIQVTFANRGASLASGAELTLFADNMQLGDTFSLPELKGGDEGAIQLEKSFASGTKALTASLDPTNAITESDETNNKATATLEVLASNRPDLAVSLADISFSRTSPEPGDVVKVTALVHNEGAARSGGFHVLFSIGDPTAGGDTTIAEALVPAIVAAGDSIPVEAAFTVRRGGALEIFVMADSRGEVGESNENNNVAEKILVTAPLPELSCDPSSIVVDHTDLTGLPVVEIKATISNWGNAPSRPFDVTIADVGSEVGIDEDSGIKIVTRRIPALHPYESAEIKSLMFPSYDRERVMMAVVDGKHEVVESNEDNNIITKTFSFDMECTALDILAGDETAYVYGDTRTGGYYRCDSFGAYDRVFLVTTTNYTWDYGQTDVLCDIVTPDGNRINIPQIFLHGWTEPRLFLTTNKAPGQYIVELRTVNHYSGVEHDQLNGSFEVVPTRRISALNPSIQPRHAFEGTTSKMELVAEMANGSNVTISGRLQYQLLDPQGGAITAGSIPVVLEPEQTYRQLPLEQFPYTFAMTGNYQLKLKAEMDGMEPVEATDTLEVLPLPAAGPVPAKLDLTLPLGGELSQKLSVTTGGAGQGDYKYDVVFVFEAEQRFRDYREETKAFTAEIMSAFKAKVSDVHFGLADYCDFPYYPWGDNWKHGIDAPYQLQQTLTADTDRISAAFNSIYAYFGYDMAQSQLECIYQLATGAGKDLNSDGDYYDAGQGDIEPSSAGWRLGSKRLVVMTTETMFHEGGDTAPRADDPQPNVFGAYPFPYPGETFDATIQALVANDIHFAGIMPNVHWYYSGNDANPWIREYGPVEGDLTRIAAGTGAVDLNGAPLVFRRGSFTAESFVKAALEAMDFIHSSTLSVRVTGDSGQFFQAVTPEAVPDVGPNQTVEFTLAFKGTTPATIDDQIFEFNLDVMANGARVVASVPVRVTVPSKIPLKINVDKEVYSQSDTALLTTTAQLPSSLNYQFVSNQDEFGKGTLSGIDINSKPGELLLAKTADGAYVSEGTLNYVVDAAASANWMNIVYSGNFPDGTTLSIRTRSAPTVDTLGFAKFSVAAHASGMAVVSSPSRYLEIEVKLATNDVTVTPALDFLNVGYNSQDLALSVLIEDKDGQTVHEFPSVALSPDQYGKELVFQNRFHVSDANPGEYTAKAVVMNSSTQAPIQSATTSFTSLANPIEQELEANVSTDKQKYTSSEIVTILSRGKNISPNMPFPTLVAAVSVTGPNGEPTLNQEYSINNLLSGAINDKQIQLPVTSSMSVGQYTVNQNITCDGENISTRQANFEVVASVTAGSGVSGTLAASPTTVKRRVGGTELSVTAKNSGNVDLAGVKLLVDVTDPASGLAIKSFAHVADLPMGASVNCSFDLDSVAFDPKSYPVSLHADFSYGTDSYRVPLDVAGVTVTNDIPVANAGADQSKEGSSSMGDIFTLDGSGSTDGNSTNPPANDDDIASYVWSEGGGILGQGKTLDHLFACGVHPVTLTVTDTLGASSSDGVVVTVADTVAPTVANLSPVNGTISANATPELAALVADACSGVDSPTIELKLNGAILAYSFDPATGRITATPSGTLPDGWNQAVLAIKDKAGNQGSSPEWRFGVDTAAPVIAGLSPVGDSIVADSSPELAATLSDSFSGVDSASVELTIDGAAVASNYLDGQFSSVPTSLSDGWHDLAVSAKDMVGNVGHSAAWRLGVDTTAPTASNLFPAHGSTIANSQPLFEAVVADAFSGVDPASVSISLDGTTLVCNFDASSGKVVAATPSTLADGSHQVSLAAKDALGNAAAPTQWQFVVDATAPVIADLSPANGAIGGGSTPTLSLALSDALVGVDTDTIVLTVDGAALAATFADGMVTVTVDTPLADGWHDVALAAKDLVGNQATSLEWKIGVDTTPPTIANLAPADGADIDNALPALSAILADSFSGVNANSLALTLDGTALAASYDAATGAVTATPDTALADGAHSAALTVKDNAGNQSSSQWTFTVTTAKPPTITIVCPANGSIIKRQCKTAIVAIVTDSEDGGGINASSIAMTVDGVAVATTYNAATGKVTACKALADGWHEVVLTVKNNAGFQSTSPEWRFAVDGTPPVISDLSPAPCSTVMLPDLEIGATLADALSGVDSSTISVKLDCSYLTFTYDPATGKLTVILPATVRAGCHYVKVTVADNVGNWTSKCWTFGVRLPSVPTIAIVCPANGAFLKRQCSTSVVATVSDTINGIDASSIAMTIDGVAVNASYSSSSGKVTACKALADGWHVVVLTVKNNIGVQATSPEWRFAVDGTPPVISNLSPAPCSTVLLANLELGTTLTDALSGVDPSTISVKLDCSTLAFAYDPATGKLTATLPATVRLGCHYVKVTVADNVGNWAEKCWTFSVRTPSVPTITNLCPANGATVSQQCKTTISATVADCGGIDASSIHMTVDGAAVAASYAASTGKVSFAQKLAVGWHEVVLTVKNNDGVQATSPTWTFKVKAACLVFHNSHHCELKIDGCRKRVNGDIHCNGDIKVGGSDNHGSGRTSACGGIRINGQGNDFPSRQEHAPDEDMPEHSLDHYRQCADFTHNGGWTVNSRGSIPDGVHFVTGDVLICGDRKSAHATIVATGSIRITGQGVCLQDNDPDGRLVLFSGSGDINVSGGGGQFRGGLHAPNGLCRLSGSSDSFNGQISADRVEIAGDDKTFDNIQ